MDTAAFRARYLRRLKPLSQIARDTGIEYKKLKMLVRGRNKLVEEERLTLKIYYFRLRIGQFLVETESFLLRFMFGCFDFIKLFLKSVGELILHLLEKTKPQQPRMI